MGSLSLSSANNRHKLDFPSLGFIEKQLRTNSRPGGGLPQYHRLLVLLFHRHSPERNADGILATFIGLLTFSIVIFGQPYDSELRVQPSAYELVYDRVIHG
jgi:hypothetical protein